MAKTFWVVSNTIGSADPQLGAILMRNFLYSLARDETRPARVLFANEGVRLACEGSGVLEDLRLLVQAGVVVKACGTCLDFLGLTGDLAVGEVGDMTGLVAVLSGDADVVTVS